MAEPIRGAAQMRAVLQFFAGVVASWWFLFWFLNPITNGETWLNKIMRRVHSNFIGAPGDRFMLEQVPFVLLAFIGFGVFELKKRIKPSITARQGPKKRRTNIWSKPLIVRGPLGTLTLLDIVIIFTVLFTALWYLIKGSVQICRQIDVEPTMPGDPAKFIQKVKAVSIQMGVTQLLLVSLLWIPVSRQSPILKIIGVPFEHAVKYHVWLGTILVPLIVVHGATMIWYFIQTDTVNKKGLFSWATKTPGVIPGFLAGLSAIVMFFTAHYWVRRKNFDLFFSVHHLYLVFVLFISFHVPWFVDIFIIPFLLFVLDRFMRMVQSRKTVDVLSAKVLGAGAIELRFAKPEGLTYDALSFVYVNLPSVSKLFWHPFSVASCSLEGSNSIVIYIKPSGGFTKDLHDLVLNSNHAQQSKSALYKCPFSFKARLEGPYGSPSAYYLGYKSLVMVAGGIGVTPFLAILKDLLHRHRLQHEDLPNYIHVIFVVRSSRELHLLDTIEPDSILPGYEERLNILVEAYVTKAEKPKQENNPTASTGQMTMTPMDEEVTMPAMEEADKTMTPMEEADNTMTPTDEAGKWTQEDDSVSKEDIVLYSSSPNPKQEMSRTGPGAGDTRWVAATFAATLAGYYVSFGIISLKYSKTQTTGPIRVMIYLVGIFWGVVVCGGSVMLLWNYYSRRSDSKVISARLPRNQMSSDVEDVEQSRAGGPSLWRGNVNRRMTYGKRPNWGEIFGNFEKKYEDGAVLVSGRELMQQAVAKVCTKNNIPFHSLSFSL